MTRKHYRQLADTLGRAYAAGVMADKTTPEGAGRFFEILEELESFCRAENASFDRTRFREAVGVAIRDEQGEEVAA
jgi:hypothetical protein